MVAFSRHSVAYQRRVCGEDHDGDPGPRGGLSLQKGISAISFFKMRSGPSRGRAASTLCFWGLVSTLDPRHPSNFFHLEKVNGPARSMSRNWYGVRRHL
jgi:hypothetical protein